MLLDIDLTDRSLYRSGFPHDMFTELRERGAVLQHPRVALDRAPQGVEFWAVVRHAEVQEASRDWERFSSHDGPVLAIASEMQGSAVVYADPPTHTRLRKLISAGFTPRMIARLDDQVQLRTREILDAAAARGDVDFVRDIVHRLPMHIIADIVGIPESDRDDVFGLTDTFMRAPDPRSGLTYEQEIGAQVELYQYASALGAEKRARPTNDVWSLLASAEIVDDDTGETVRLSEFQLDLFFLVLSVAGSETTRNAISHGLLALLDRPRDLADLCDNPALWDTATDEVVRWSSPVTNFVRTATRDTELGGVPIAAGERVALFFPSVNRDERAFADPFRFDIRRSPNPHVAFGGGGIHYCLGAHLARREIRTLFEQLLARFDTIELTGEPTWSVPGPDQAVAVGADTMPVRLGGK